MLNPIGKRNFHSKILQTFLQKIGLYKHFTNKIQKKNQVFTKIQRIQKIQKYDTDTVTDTVNDIWVDFVCPLRGPTNIFLAPYGR